MVFPFSFLADCAVASCVLRRLVLISLLWHPRFAKEFFELYDKFEDFMRGKGKVSTPIQIQIASPENESDGLVLNSVTKQFCNSAFQHCTVNNKPGARHNIWWETDAIRNPALREAARFFDAYAKAPKNGQCPLPAPCGKWDYWRFRCDNSAACSYQYRWGDWHLGMSCRTRNDAC